MHRIIQVFLLLITAACGILGLDEQRVVGMIDREYLSEYVVVPDTVQQNVPFSVTVITMGGGCDRRTETALFLEGRVATMVLFEVHKLGRNCADALGFFEHTADIVFEQVGRGEVVILARDLSGEALEIGRDIWVR